MKQTLGSRLRSLRGDESQMAFCSKIKQKQGTYSAWERDEKDPSSTAIAFICECCNVSADWLLGLTDARPAAAEPAATPAGPADAACWRDLALSQQATIARLAGLLSAGKSTPAAPAPAGGRAATKTA